MAKKAKLKNYCKAFVNCGQLRWEYRVDNNQVIGRQSHDEDVDGWTDQQIVELTRQMLGLDDGAEVEVIYL